MSGAKVSKHGCKNVLAVKFQILIPISIGLKAGLSTLTVVFSDAYILLHKQNV